MKKIISGTILVCALVGAPFSAALPETGISSRDIPGKYSIIGPLGIRLGLPADLDVRKIVPGTKRGRPELRIVSMNGRPLHAPVTLGYRMLIVDDRFGDDKTYRVRAYQDGCFTGTPREVLNEVMFQSADYGFEVTLVVFKYLD